MTTSFDECAVCGASPLQPFVNVGPVPVNCSAFSKSQDEARRAPTAHLQLSRCPRCGFVQNSAFDPGLLDYDEGYDNSLRFSPTFAAYEESLIRDLVDRSGLRQGQILEIGSGDGHFLSLLCQASDSQGTGFDPSWSESEESDSRVTIHSRYYDETCAVPPPNLICCRHVLEHLCRPKELLVSLRQAAAEADGRLYVEVPNADHIFGSDDLWDLIYQHFGYFSASSLRRLVASAGFIVDEMGESFGRQFLSLHGSVPGTGKARQTLDNSTDEPSDSRDSFSRRLAAKMGNWSERLHQWQTEGLTSCLWGAGSRGVTFLNVVPGASSVGLVVDSNPRKIGLHVPGTGQMVVSPADGRIRAADRVIVMNPIYAKEISVQLRSVGSSAAVVVV